MREKMSEEKIHLLYSEKDIVDRVAALAGQINRDFSSGDVVLVGVLKGAFVFLADLMRRLSISPVIDFVWLSSYGDKTVSSGTIEIVRDLQTDIYGKDVIVVEDIVDTGLTLAFLKNELSKRQPRSLRVCVLLDKRFRREVDLEPDYTAITLNEDLFVVGYGLDSAEHYRHLPGVYYVTS
jgi:hypoxanthine phosphoribosyltransferase